MNSEDIMSECFPEQFTWSKLKMLGQTHKYVVYEGKVYDVSSFVSRHPGGYDQIMSGVGHDITQLFKSYHKPETATKVLSKYYVGDVVDKDILVYTKESKLYEVLRNKVDQYMQRNGLDSKIHHWHFLYYSVIIALYFTFMYLSINSSTPVICCAYAVIWGYLIQNIWLAFFHDNLHFCITHNPLIWRILTILASSITGHSSYIWHYRHVVGHHIYTNTEDYDPDFDAGKPFTWRIQSSVKWLSWFSFQHLYACVIYMLTFSNLKLHDFEYAMTLRMKTDTIRLNPLTHVQWLEFIATKLIHVMISFVIPLVFSPLTYPYIIMMFVIREFVCSYVFAQIVFLTHINEQAEMVMEESYAETKTIPNDWAEHQLSSTVDFCTDSWFWSILSGYINHQTAHHLFPGYNPGHYHWITPIVKRTCAELGVQYNCVDTFTDILRLHYGYLKKMGNQQDMEIIRNKNKKSQ